LLLASCSPAAKLRRANRLIVKAEKEGAVWRVDTVFRTVEVPVPEVRTDTVFQSVEGDTVLIEKDKLSIKYVRLPGNKVYIEGKSKADTIRIKETVTIHKTIKAGKSRWYHIKWAALIAIIFFIGGYLYRALSSRKINITVEKEKPKPT